MQCQYNHTSINYSTFYSTAFFDQQVESLELHEFVRIYQVVCGSYYGGAYRIRQNFGVGIFRGSSAKWGKLSRLHARALITRIANRQGHVQSQTGCCLLVTASM